MALRDKSKIQGLFSSSAGFSLDYLEEQLDNDKEKRKLSPFKQKLRDENFEDFVWKDWKEYFKFKAKACGIDRFIPGNPAKESQILKSLMTKFSPYEIKEMIDFVWDCDEHKLVPHKNTMGIWILSSGYLQSVTQLMETWKREGTLMPKQNRPLTESKWDNEEPVVVTKPKKKSRITVGGD